MRGFGEEPFRVDPRRVGPEGCASKPRLYVVGEAPGAREAESRRPFVGPAGGALREMLAQAEVDAACLRLANAIPFRPVKPVANRKPRNRAPTAREIATLGRSVLADIARTRPAIILALGSAAARLFGITERIQQARKRQLRFRGVPLRVTYHPAYVRRFGGRGSDLWRQTVADIRSAWAISAKDSAPRGLARSR